LLDTCFLLILSKFRVMSMCVHCGIHEIIGKQRAMSLDIWPIPTIDTVIGYSCEYSVLSTQINT